MDGKFYNDDPMSSSTYTDKLGNDWTVAKDDALGGTWWAEPANATSVKYQIPIAAAGSSRHRITGTDKGMVADGIDEAVYRWRITKGDLVSVVKPGGGAWIWFALLAAALAMDDDKRRR